MTPELFVDTSAWYPLAVGDHPAHASIVEALEQRVLDGVVVLTSNLVVAETHALLLTRVGRSTAERFLREVGQDPILVVGSTPALEEAAHREWIVRYDDQAFSLCDAVSFAIMRDRGVTEALALDRHFSTAGFTRLPAAGRNG